MSTNVFDKDPGAKLDYVVDWKDWLNGDTIATSTWTVPSGLTKESDGNSTTTATVWLSGGTVGTTYEVVNRITTAAGRINERTIFILIVEL